MNAYEIANKELAALMKMMAEEKDPAAVKLLDGKVEAKLAELKAMRKGGK